MQPPELFAEYYHETGPGCLCVQHGRTGRGRDLHPGWLIVNLPYEVPLCFYKMNEELAVRYVYLYKKRNKYLTKAMEEFIRVAVGDEAFQKVREQREKENQERKGSDKKGDK